MEAVLEAEPVAPVEEAKQPSIIRQLLLHIVAGLISVGMGFGAFWLFSKHNDFPVYYHPDEWSKAAQVASANEGSWNFNHPLLMLQAARLRAEWYDIPRETHAQIISGRTTSAMLAAVGVTGLAVASYVAYGFAGLFIGGLGMMLCPPLLVYAHYFKEDAALVTGIMIALLGARLVTSGGSVLGQTIGALVLGLGCGAAASGKYVGIACVAPALVTLLVARTPRLEHVILRFTAFLVAGFATIVIINYPGFVDWTTLRFTHTAEMGFRNEYEHGTTSHYGIGMKTPNSFDLRVAASEMMIHGWIFIAAGAIWAAYRRRMSRWGIALAAFLVTWVVVLAYNVIPFGRYALPITVCLYFISVQFAASVVADRAIAGKVRLALFSLALVGIGLQAHRCSIIIHELADDSRQRIREWIVDNLPAGATVIAENYTDLHDEGDPHRFPNQRPMRINLIPTKYVAYSGTLEALQAQGIQYVAIARPNWERFFVPEVQNTYGTPRTVEECREFYEDLRQRGELLWTSSPRVVTNSYINPELHLYRITNLKPKG